MGQIKLIIIGLLATVTLMLIKEARCQDNNHSTTELNHGDYTEPVFSTYPTSSSPQTETDDFYNKDNSSVSNDTDNGEEDEHHGIHVASLRIDYVRQPLIITLFVIVAAICKLGFHHANFLSSILPESCLLTILGIVVGAVIKFSGSAHAFPTILSPTLFFLFLLPPVILESAYSLHDRVFYDNIGTILVYAVVGTLLNCFILGPVLYGLALSGAMGTISISLLDCLVFCSLIVAVDPVAVLAIFQEIGVNNVLYFLLFGESLLNDAVTVVLYNTMTVFLEMETIPVRQIFLAVAAFFVDSLGGLAVGGVIGVITAIVTQFTGKVRVVEALTLLSFAYCAYLVGELFHFSGIISMIGCGLVQARYAFHNISDKSLITISYLSKILSGTSDAVIFMFLGLTVVTDEEHQWHTGFILWTVFLTLLIRFAVVYGLTFIANSVWRYRMVDLEEQFIMAYGGLRGAVAFSLVILLEKDQLELRNLFVTTTLAVIVFTVLIQGITIKPLVKLLKISKESQEAATILQEINTKMIKHLRTGMEVISGDSGNSFVREKMRYAENTYFKRWFQKNPKTKHEIMIDSFQEIALQLHYETVAQGGVRKRHKSGADQYSPDVIKRLTTIPGSEDAMSNGMTQSPDLADRAAEFVRSFSGRRHRQPLHEAGSHDDDNSDAESVKSGNVYKEDPTVDDVRRWFVQTPSKNRDSSIIQDDNTDIIHHLREKQRRLTRHYRQSKLARASFTSGGSNLPVIHVTDETRARTPEGDHQLPSNNHAGHTGDRDGQDEHELDTVKPRQEATNDDDTDEETKI